MGVIAVIVGGVGSIPGAVLGGLLIGMTQHLGGVFFTTRWQDSVVFTVLLLFLILRPQGLLGSQFRKAAV